MALTSTNENALQAVLKRYLHDCFPGTENCILTVERNQWNDSFRLRLMNPETLTQYEKFVATQSLHTDMRILNQELQVAAEQLGYHYTHPNPINKAALKSFLDLLT